MKKEITLLVLAVLLTAAAQASSIDINLADQKDQNVETKAGSPVEVTVNIFNNQATSEQFQIFTAGLAAPWTTSSPSTLTIPANSQASVVIRIEPTMSTPAGPSPLKITATSPGTNQWSTITLNVNVNAQSSGSKGIHQLISVPSNQNSRLHLNIYYDYKVYNKNDYNLKDGDECCVGDTFTVQSKVLGDYNGDGGPCDSPPTIMVENLAKTLKDIDSRSYTPPVYDTPVGTYLARCDFCCPQCKGLSKCACTCSRFGNMGEVDCSNIKRMAIVCESPCKMIPTGEAYSDDKGFKTVREGSVKVNIECKTSCVAYEERTGKYEYIEIAKAGNAWYDPTLGGSTAVATEVYSYNAVKDERKPDVRVNSYSYVSAAAGGKTVMKADIENAGEVIAYIDKVSLNIPNYKILYSPASIGPKQKAEMLFETAQKDITGVKADVKYTSEKTGCLKTKAFAASFFVGSCRMDSDCDDKVYETEDVCNNPGAVDSYCTNTKYNSMKPVSSIQTYGMDVSGDCVNNYYSCSSPNLGETYITGFGCHNTQDLFETHSAPRYSMKFDLSTIAKNINVTAIRLYLTAVNVGTPQEVSVYSINDDWSEASCAPEGDICSKPYCPECSPAHDAPATLIAKKQIDQTGTYSYDVTEYVEGKYSNGDRYVSFQVRGTEEMQPCGIDGEWKKYEIEFSAVNVGAPELRMLQ
jgi:hypothetical protein